MARRVLPWSKMIGATEGLADRADGKVCRLSFGDLQQSFDKLETNDWLHCQT